VALALRFRPIRHPPRPLDYRLVHYLPVNYSPVYY